jgi:hypothetical protein
LLYLREIERAAFWDFRNSVSQERSFCRSFDHLVRVGEEALFEGYPWSFRGLQIDHQLEFGGSFGTPKKYADAKQLLY